jgi:hypothetical protein
MRYTAASRMCLATGLAHAWQLTLAHPLVSYVKQSPAHSREGVPGKGGLSAFPGLVITKPSSFFLPPPSGGSDSYRYRFR